MTLDARTVVFIITLSTLLISLGLALVARGPLGRLKSVSQWAMATGIQALGWIVTGLLRGKITDLVSIVVGNCLMVASLLLYMLIIAGFLRQPVKRGIWLSLLLPMAVAMTYYQVIEPDVAKRTAIVSAFVCAITLNSARLLLSTRPNVLPSSRFMIGIYIFSGGFMFARVAYFLFISNAADQQPFSGSGFKDFSLVIFYLFSVLLPFGFILMCNDRYVTQHNRVEHELLEKTHLFERLASLVPGTIYQYQRFADGRTCFPFASDGIEKMYEVKAEDVRHDATIILDRIHPDDRDELVASIRQSAEQCTTW